MYRELLAREGLDAFVVPDGQQACNFLMAGERICLLVTELSLPRIDGFGVLRDPIACKPAVLAETDRYVAFGSEYRALAGLPGIEDARVWEPEPATVYFWER